jgi:hypothetical protein
MGPSPSYMSQAMAWAISRRVVPRASSDLMSRSIETLGSPRYARTCLIRVNPRKSMSGKSEN